MQIGIKFDGQSLDRTTKLLAGLGDGKLPLKAMQSAMSRTTQYLGTQTAKRVREQYAISKQSLRINENIRIKQQQFLDGIQAEISFSNQKIPLYRYAGTSPKLPTPDRRKIAFAMLSGHWKTVHPSIAAKAHQKVSTKLTEFEHAFVAQMKSGHIGIFERVSETSSKIRELQGSSIAQMVGNEQVAQSLVDDAYKKFEERLKHETDRLLERQVKRITEN